ncbi:MAG: hypothetical protein AABY22_19965 [Nanoarchaeota archaeon]
MDKEAKVYKFLESDNLVTLENSVNVWAKEAYLIESFHVWELKKNERVYIVLLSKRS